MSFAIWKYPVHFLAYGLGTGFVPPAPGTFGSLLGVAIFILAARLSAIRYAALIVVLGFAGIFICGQTARDRGMIDPGFIVFDEIVGFLVAMFGFPRDWRWITAGFVVYRVFDIWKPFPIHIVEQEFELGVAIMADDIIAGLYTLAILSMARLVIARSTS